MSAVRLVYLLNKLFIWYSLAVVRLDVFGALVENCVMESNVGNARF